MKRKKQTKTRSQKIKTKARKTLKNKFSKTKKVYVVDTSAVINKFLPNLIKKGLKGKIIIPHAVMAELENLANKGREEGFIGLEQISELHAQQGIKVCFGGKRPTEMQIKFAKSGEIDALIRQIAKTSRAVLITADLVQAKSAQAYGIQVLFLRPKPRISQKKKFKFLFWELQK